ncbi:hypothetical protein QBC42DRAFT_350917 [Cladorrhinum samala]|uniref:Uncharacterized protein n=1 Tax=Cladorrhinum samala TaxID=585594 RepID=A0AAV9H8K7_9PEZI|nr:hypothetical protein QBC42DRAFT_350917 [Cladorrhinum samala]
MDEQETNPFRMPAAAHIECTASLRSLGEELPETGIHFAYLMCSRPSLWSSKYILDAFLKNTKGFRLIYLVPDVVSAETFKKYCRQQDDPLCAALGDKTFLVLPYRDFSKQFRQAQHLNKARLLIDTNIGRYTAALVDMASTLARLCAENRENLSLSVVALKYDANDADIWNCSSIFEIVGRYPRAASSLPISNHHHVELGSVTLDPADPLATLVDHLVTQLKAERMDLDEGSAASEHPAVVGCLASPDDADKIRKLLKLHADSFRPALKIYIFSCSQILQSELLMSNLDSKANVILLIDPSIRFISPCRGLRNVSFAQDICIDAWDHQMARVVKKTICVGRKEACHLACLGQVDFEHRIKVIGLFEQDFQHFKQRPEWQTPPRPASAWDSEVYQTLLLLISQLSDAGEYNSLDQLHIRFPIAYELIDEIVRCLSCMGLVRWPWSIPLHAMHRQLRLTPRGAELVENHLYTSHGRTNNSIHESILSLEIAQASSDSVKLVLAAVASLAPNLKRIAQDHQHRESPLSLDQLQEHSAGVGKQFCRKGRIWAALGVVVKAMRNPKLASATDNTGLDTSLVEVVAKLFMGHQNVGVGLDKLPDSLAEDEVVAVDLALVASFITHLTIVARKGDDKRYIDITTGTRIEDDPDLGWGADLEETDDCRFAIHFGLTKLGPGRYTTESLTLISNDAIRKYMSTTFPSVQVSEHHRYIQLLRTVYPEVEED